MAQALLHRNGRAAHMTQVERLGHPQEIADGLGQALRVIGRLGHLGGDPPQHGRKRRRAVAEALLLGEPLVEVASGLAVAVVLEHAREQLLGRLLRLEVELFLVLHRKHQPRLELQQRRDQHQELRGRLQVELARALEVLHVGEHHFGELDLQQVDLLGEHQRQQ